MLDKKSFFIILIMLIMMDYVGNLVLRVWLERKKDVTSPLGRSVPVSPANCNFTALSSSNWFLLENQQNIWQLSFDKEVKLAYSLKLSKDLILLAKDLKKNDCCNIMVDYNGSDDDESAVEPINFLKETEKSLKSVLQLNMFILILEDF